MTDTDSVNPTARQELVEEYERGKRYSLDDLRMSQRHCQAQGREITELRIELAKAKLAAVTCVNLHAELVEALREMLEFNENICTDHNLSTDFPYAARARAVLAKVKPEPTIAWFKENVTNEEMIDFLAGKVKR